MGRLAGFGWVIRARMASITSAKELSWCDTRRSNAASLSASALWSSRTARSYTKARTTYTLISTARSELSTHGGHDGTVLGEGKGQVPAPAAL